MWTLDCKRHKHSLTECKISSQVVAYSVGFHSEVHSGRFHKQACTVLQAVAQIGRKSSTGYTISVRNVPIEEKG